MLADSGIRVASDAYRSLIVTGNRSVAGRLGITVTAGSRVVLTGNVATALRPTQPT